jgi:hypothetical protein
MLSTENMTWNPVTRTLSAEASTLGLVLGRPLPANPVVCSHRTGVTRQFTFVRNDMTPDSEVTGWRFRSGDINLLIIND